MVRRTVIPAWIAALLWFITAAQPAFCASGDDPVTQSIAPQPRVMVFAFVGGFVHKDDARHPEVQLIRRLQEAYPGLVESHVFENRRNKAAYRLIRQQLDANHDGKLSEEEKHSARILLFGHSWGASATVFLARWLERDGIPVLLTAQVDSITKIGQNDSVIPSNVREAVNFYQTRGWLHGQSRIKAADPSRTKILGNIKLSYDRQPEACNVYPWYDLLFTRPHTEIECDPHVWTQIEKLVRNQLSDSPTESLIQLAVEPTQQK